MSGFIGSFGKTSEREENSISTCKPKVNDIENEGGAKINEELLQKEKVLKTVPKL